MSNLDTQRLRVISPPTHKCDDDRLLRLPRFLLRIMLRLGCHVRLRCLLCLVGVVVVVVGVIVIVLLL